MSIFSTRTLSYNDEKSGEHGFLSNDPCRPQLADIESATTPAPSAQADEPVRGYTTIQWILILVAIYSSQLLYGLDNTIVADVQGPVVEEFGDSQVSKLGWLGIGFPLGGVATLLSLGKAYAVFDVKWLYVGSLVMFTAGSALCGAAPNMEALIIGRVWAGAGGAGMYLGVLNLISINTTLRERPIYIGISGLIWGAGSILGPVIGGAFADSEATWRWAFYLNLILFGIFSPIYFFILKPYSYQPEKTLLHKLTNLNWLGVGLNAGVWVLFSLLFTSAGNLWAWNDGRTIALFVVFGIVLIAFVASQAFAFLTTKTDRLFPGDFLRSKTMVLLYICQGSSSPVLFVPVYYIPLYFQFVFGDSGMDAAIRLLPFITVAIATNMFSGYMMPRYGYYMPWFLIAGIFTIVGSSLFYTAVDAQTPVAQIYGFSVLLAVGGGLCQQTAYSVAAAKVAPHRVPDAVAFINTAQIGSIVISLVLSSMVFQNVGFRYVASALDGQGFSAADIHGALAGQRSYVLSRVTEEVRLRVVEGIVRGIREVYIIVLVAGIVCTVATMGLKKERLILEMAAGA